MIVELPEWQPYTPDHPTWMPEVSDSGRVVVALAPPAATRERWSPDVVLGLADAWGEAGHRVVLVDAVLEHPTLHRSTGLPNEEGVSDAAQFGASVSRVAKPVPGRSFFFVSAGSPAGDAEAVLSSARWGRLQKGFRDAGVTLVVFLREGCAGEAELLDGANDIIVLAESVDRAPRSARAAAHKVRMLIGVHASSGEFPGAGAPETDTPPAAPLPDAGASITAPMVEPPEPVVSPTPGGELSEEAVLDFTASDPDVADPLEEGASEGVAASGAEAGQGPPDQETPPPLHEPVRAAEAEPAPLSATRRARRVDADPNVRKKLLWVLIGILVLVTLVVLGALRQG